jgi:hypothetical protein
MPPYLQKRGSLYYARLRIPEELVPHYKKKQLIKSLKTHELHEAKPRALNAVAEWQTEFEVLRGKLTPLNEKALQIRTIAAGLDTTVDPDTGESERSLYLDFEFEKLRDQYEFGDATTSKY